MAKFAGEKILIKDARFPDQEWRQEHLRQIKDAYHSAPHFSEIYEGLVKEIYAFDTSHVAEFCIYGMERLLSHLHINAELHRSSDLSTQGSGSQRVLEHCLLFGSTQYISGLGARNYIDYDLFEKHGVQIYYMQYPLTPYPQLYGEFDPYVSVLDLLFNVGPGPEQFLSAKAKYWKDADIDHSKWRPK